MFGGQPPARPMRRIRRGGLQRLHDHRFNHISTDRSRRAGPGCVNQAVETQLGEPLTPFAHGHPVAAQLGNDLAVQITVGAGQHDLATQRQNLRRRMTLRPTLQRRTLVSAQNDLDRRSSAMCHGVLPMFVDNTRPTRHHRENSQSTTLSQLNQAVANLDLTPWRPRADDGSLSAVRCPPNEFVRMRSAGETWRRAARLRAFGEGVTCCRSRRCHGRRA